MRFSMLPFGIYYLVKAMRNVPYFLWLAFQNGQTENFTMLFSNVAGPKKPLVYSGSTCHKFGFFVASLGKTSCGLSLLSIENTIKIGFLTDKDVCDEPQVFVDLLENVLND